MKQIKLTLVGLDGNAFNLLGQFQRAARQQGMEEDELKGIVKDATSGDYDHLLQVLVANTVDEHEDEDEYDEDEDWD